MNKMMFFLSFLLVGDLSAAPTDINKNFVSVFEALAGKNVINSDLNKLITKIKENCVPSARPDKEQYKIGNVECERRTDILRLFIDERTGDGVGSITADISGLDKCEYVIETLRKNFGLPTKASGTCELTWELKPTKKGNGRRIVEVEANKGRNMIYLSIQEEAGP